MSSPRPAVRRRRRGVRSLVRSGLPGLALALTAALAVQPAAWSAAALPTPKAPVAQPVAAEPLQPYVPQTSCDPVIQPGVRKFRDLMLATYKTGADGGSVRACAGAGVSEHVEGRAWDWMLPVSNTTDKAVATSVIAWLLKPGPDGVPALEARRLGIMYIMYNHRIWGTWDAAWKPINPGGDPHTSHIHFSFSWAGAEGHTSFWTGKVGRVDYGPCAVYAGQPAVIYTAPNYKPCPTKLPKAPTSTHKLAWTGTRSADVARAEALLKLPVADRTGLFGTTLRDAVVAYQKAEHLPVTGALDKDTWVRLDPASATTAPPSTSTPPPTTSSGNASGPKPTTPTRWTLATWKNVQLGSSGAEVLALQAALKLAVADRTGTFGPITLAAVKAFQKAHALVVDGVVGPKTATALGLIA